MDGPWNQYPPDDPRAQPYNWQPSSTSETGFIYVGHSSGGPTISEQQQASATPPDPQYGYLDPNGQYISYSTGGMTGNGGYGSYDPLSSAPPPPVQPTPGIFSPSQVGGTLTPQPSNYGPSSGAVDYNYTATQGNAGTAVPLGYDTPAPSPAIYDPPRAAPANPTQEWYTTPVDAAAPVGVSAPPAAPGGAVAPDASIPMTASTDPVTGQTVYTQPAADPYGGGGFSFPNGQRFGAPRQMPVPGQFDPFAWAGVGNPRPAPNASQLYVLQQLGLAPQPEAPPKPLGPIAYTAAKLGIEAPNVQFSFPNPMQQQQQMPPGQMPPLPQYRQLQSNVPQAAPPQLPDLPVLPIPRRGNFRT